MSEHHQEINLLAEEFESCRQILLALKNSTGLQNLWKRYQIQNLYAKDITYPMLMETVSNFSEKIAL